MLNGQRCYFRVDASLAIGSGHVIRCLTLARAMQQKGAEVSFVCRQHEGDLIDMVSREFPVHNLPAVSGSLDEDSDSHEHWLGTSWQQDANDTIAAIDAAGCDWMIMDHYALDAHWQQELASYYRHLMVIDDLADRRHHADILLDQNEYPDREQRYQDLVNTDCQQLLGPEYTLLRDEFTRLEPRDRSGEVKHLLVFFGGADNSNETAKTLQAVVSLATPLVTTVVLGSSNRHAATIRQMAAGIADTEVLQAVDNMAELMQQADLAIGAGGTTTWERASLGLPAITLSQAENHVAVNQAMHDRGACWYLGDTETSQQELETAINSLLNDPARVQAMSHAARTVMQNHRGCSGVIAAMETINAAE